MFGYIVMNKPEIKMKDFDMYRTFYCGLCRELREKYGISGQITLSYDMTFVIMLLSGLYEPKTYNYQMHSSSCEKTASSKECDDRILCRHEYTFNLL